MVYKQSKSEPSKAPTAWSSPVNVVNAKDHYEALVNRNPKGTAYGNIASMLLQMRGITAGTFAGKTTEPAKPADAPKKEEPKQEASPKKDEKQKKAA